jgi:hypothetical protein
MPPESGHEKTKTVGVPNSAELPKPVNALCLTGEFGRDWRFDGSTEAVEFDFTSFRSCAAGLYSNHLRFSLWP